MPSRSPTVSAEPERVAADRDRDQNDKQRGILTLGPEYVRKPSQVVVPAPKKSTAAAGGRNHSKSGSVHQLSASLELPQKGGAISLLAQAKLATQAPPASAPCSPVLREEAAGKSGKFPNARGGQKGVGLLPRPPPAPVLRPRKSPLPLRGEETQTSDSPPKSGPEIHIISETKGSPEYPPFPKQHPTPTTAEQASKIGPYRPPRATKANKNPHQNQNQNQKKNVKNKSEQPRDPKGNTNNTNNYVPPRSMAMAWASDIESGSVDVHDPDVIKSLRRYRVHDLPAINEVVDAWDMANEKKPMTDYRDIGDSPEMLREKSSEIVLRIFFKILVMRANFGDFGILVSTSKFWKKFVTCVTPYWDKFWKVLTFEFWWNRKVMINHRGGILIFGQILSKLKILDFRVKDFKFWILGLRISNFEISPILSISVKFSSNL